MVNKSLEHYRRAFATDKPTTWVEWLPLVEFWFNTNFHVAAKMTPFEALYGYPPSRVLDYVTGITRVGAVDSLLKGRQQLLSLLKQNLCAAQERMRWFTDKKRVERSLTVGEWVYLRLQPYKQFSVHHKKIGKLAPRYYGPFQVIQRIGEVSYSPRDLLFIPCSMFPTSKLSCETRWCLGLHCLL